MESGLFLEGVVVLSTLIGFNDPDSPGASTCPAQDPMSAPAPVMLQQGQSPDHHSLSPTSHPSPSLSPGMAPSAGAAPSATPGSSGWSDGVALDGEALLCSSQRSITSYQAQRLMDGLNSPHWAVGEDFGTGERRLSWLSSYIIWQFLDNERCEMEVLNTTCCLSICFKKCFT